MQVTATVTANGVRQTATADVTLSTTILKCEKKVTGYILTSNSELSCSGTYIYRLSDSFFLGSLGSGGYLYG